MAGAVVYPIQQFTLIGNSLSVEYNIAYVGSDASPSGVLTACITSTVSVVGLTPAILNTQMAADVRAFATSSGFTVPASGVMMPTYTAT
jgi:hypothetical protein